MIADRNSYLQCLIIGFFLIPGLAISSLTAVVRAVEKEGDDPLDWLRDSIPGEPGVDYPIFGAVEQTSFSCEGKVFGGKNIFNINWEIERSELSKVS